MCFASIMNVSDGAAVPRKKHCSKGNGRKETGVAAVSLGVDTKVFTPMKLPMSREANKKIIVVSWEAATTILHFPLCAHPMLPLEASLTFFKAMLDSNSVVLRGKEQVTKTADYLTKLLVTMAALVNKSTPAVVALYDAIPCDEEVGG